MEKSEEYLFCRKLLQLVIAKLVATVSIRGQGHYLTFHKGHFIFILGFCFSQKLLDYFNIM